MQSISGKERHPSHVLSDVFARDRRKLTFYFIAEKRIDFRELVRELFRYVCNTLNDRNSSLLSGSTKPEFGWPRSPRQRRWSYDPRKALVG